MNLLAAFLQDVPQEMPGGIGVVPFLLIVLVLYAFVSYCWMVIAQKTGTPNAWFAWIPILNLVLMLNIAKKPVWWIILFLIPLVNFIIMILAMVGVCEARGRPGWYAILFIIPVVNIGLLGYLAFAD